METDMDYGGILLKIEREEMKPGVVVLVMKGSICMGPECKQIENKVKELIAAGENRVVFDLSRVHIMDSSGLGQIVTCFCRLKKSGGFLRLASVGGTLSGLLKMTHVDKVIEIYPTALAASEDVRPDG
jgi:anti-sigma B factor antagonist